MLIATHAATNAFQGPSRAGLALLPEAQRAANSGCQPGNSPVARARATTCTRLSAPSLPKMWFTWVFTVASVTTSLRAIS